MHLIYHRLTLFVSKLSAGSELTCGIQYALSEIKRTCPNQTKCDKNYSGRCTGKIRDAVAPGALDRKLDCYTSQRREKMSSTVVAKDHQIDCFSNGDTKWTSPFFFIQGADLQMGMIQSYLEKNPVPGWEKEIELGERAVEILNKMRPKPKFFVMCGDLCHAFPDEEPEIRQRQEADFKKIFEKLDPEIPFICLSGNHDVGNQPTMETIELYKSSFGDDYFSFWCGGVRFLVLNTQYFEDASKVPELAQKHEQWLNEELDFAKQAGSRVIVLQHIPWFLRDPDEEANYFSIKPNIRHVWLEKFKNSGVVHVFAGHLHRNAGGSYHGMPVTTTSALGAQLGDDVPGLRIVKVWEEKVEQAFYSLDNLPTTIDL